uniref:WD repeat-containing protein on Y chromosome n=1 Tax=Strigamia maritima TaxID=126957 RepID=T1IXP0_STRMM
MAKEASSSLRENKMTRELHDLLSEADMSHIKLQFQVKQVLRYGVTFAEFEEIINDVMPLTSTISEEDLRTIFTKIDVHSTGLITWNGFITYILSSLQRDEAADLGIENALQSTLRVIECPHHDVIQRIDVMPQVQMNTGEVSYMVCRYVTASKDGVIAVWSQKLKLLKYKLCRSHFSSSSNSKIFPWILDMVCIPNAQMIATCSTDETICFYDVTNANMDLLISITKLEAVATCLSFWFNPQNLEHSVLVFGDNVGTVTYLEFEKAVSQKLFGISSVYEVKTVKLNDLLKKQVEHINGFQYPTLHDEWVRQVKYVSTLKSIVSCSVSSNISMSICSTFLDFSTKIFVVQKGISSFDYSNQHNMIITGSIDRCLRIWNPYINKKPIVTLSGHNAPVLHVIFIEEKYQAISISEDKCVKVWDLKEQSCIQTIYDRTMKWGNNRICAAFHDSSHRLLLLGSIKLISIERIWQPECTDKTVFISHANPLLGVTFSNIYEYIVSASDNGSIIFWDLETGQRRVKISLTHSTNFDGLEVSTAITAMSLDENGRRLLTAGGDGLLKMWSISNGVLMKSIKLPENKDINAILACKKHIYFGGWTKRVYVCNDGLHLDTMKSWPVHHTDDIMAISHIVPNHLATASWDGKVMIWVLESGQQLTVLSLQNQYVFNYMPQLQTLARSQIVGARGLDADLTIGRRSMEQNKKIDHSYKKKTKRKPSSTRNVSVALDIVFPALNCMVSMPIRIERPSVGSVFVGDTDGFVQLWSIARSGGLIAIFGNVTAIEHYTSCMVTDTENKYLFTVLTASKDKSVRVWTYSGAYLRTLGDTREWSLKATLCAPDSPMHRKIPADIGRVAAGPTLQVILQGVSPHWYRLRKIILRTYVKSIARKKTTDVAPSTPPTEEEQRKVTRTADRLAAQEVIYSKLQNPLGKNFTCKHIKRDKPDLPVIANIYKEMNCVYAYLESQVLGPISLESSMRYLETHRFPTRLKSKFEQVNKNLGSR